MQRGLRKVARLISAGVAVVGLGGLEVLGTGCSTLAGAQSTASEQTSAFKTGEGQVKGAKMDVDERKGWFGKKKDDKGGGPAAGGADPDGDDKRATAKEAKPNEPITDALNPAKGDNVDFYVLSLAGRLGPLTVELHWDDETAALNLEVFNAFGEKIAQPKGQFDGPQKRVIADIPEAGKYYVKISSIKGGSDYTFRAKWAGGTGGAAPAGASNEVPNPASGGNGPPPGPPAPGPGPGPAPGPAAGPAVPPEDPMHPRAKIIQSYRGEDGQLVLYIDKGGAANIKPGMTGQILEGADGDKPLDGGVFKITKVVDSTKSIGKASITKVGKNNRCVINLIK